MLDRDLALESFLVEHVLSESGSHTLEVGDVVGDLLDRLDLFSQEVALDPVTELQGEKQGIHKCLS